MPSATSGSNDNQRGGRQTDPAEQEQAQRQLAEKVARRVYQLWLEELRIEKERRGTRRG
jgi:hypothetical protein